MTSLNYKRRKSFWEPVYQPQNVGRSFANFDWKLENTLGQQFSICSADDLKTQVSLRKSFTVSGKHFKSCDFVGKFDFTRLTFKGCIFDDCDFERSTWARAKFSECKFLGSSISTASFSSVQFIDCEWKRTGVSAEEMKFEGVLVTNPEEFVQSAYTNTDETVLQQHNSNKPYQLYRLERTKVKIARNVLLNLENLGDDEAFYEAVMVYTTQITRAKAAEAKYHYLTQSMFSARFWLSTIKYVLYLIEGGVLSLSGRINGWGGKVGRAGLCGMALILFFSIYYLILGFFPNFSQAILASIEISLLVGYTKYTSLQTLPLQQYGFAINMVLGLWWYAVFVPTVINRVSRLQK